jgi:hypothetical protein
LCEKDNRKETKLEGFEIHIGGRYPPDDWDLPDYEKNL